MSLSNHSAGFQIQLDLEPQRLYKNSPGRFALCSKPPGGVVQQEIFDVSRLDFVLKQVSQLPQRDKTHFWLSQSTLVPGARNRRISSIMLLNACWVDIDLAHPPASFDKTLLPAGDADKDAERLAALLVMQIEDAGLPPPSYVIATGGGLCPKWLFTTAIRSAARPRWQSVQKAILDKISKIKGEWPGSAPWAWPVDRQACDAARVLRLVGSVNPRWSAPCRIVWESQKTYDFDQFADEVLPYTRAEVSNWIEKSREWKQWDKNRAAAAQRGINVSRTNVEKAMDDESARLLWSSRFEFGCAVLASRGGAQEGSRNNHFWPMANALAWSCTSADDLKSEIAALHESHFNSSDWSRTDANKAASAVMRRLKSGSLYRMQTATFLEWLDVSSAEKSAFLSILGRETAHNLNRPGWDQGVMGFEKIKDLNSDEFIAETKRRQALAGPRSAQIRKTTHSVDLREKALRMSRSGVSGNAIAAELKVDKGTVSRWIKSASTV